MKCVCVRESMCAHTEKGEKDIQKKSLSEPFVFRFTVSHHSVSAYQCVFKKKLYIYIYLKQNVS